MNIYISGCIAKIYKFIHYNLRVICVEVQLTLQQTFYFLHIFTYPKFFTHFFGQEYEKTIPNTSLSEFILSCLQLKHPRKKRI